MSEIGKSAARRGAGAGGAAYRLRLVFRRLMAIALTGSLSGTLPREGGLRARRPRRRRLLPTLAGARAAGGGRRVPPALLLAGAVAFAAAGVWMLVDGGDRAPVDVAEQLRRGVKLQLDGDNVRARRIFEGVLEQDPANAEAHFNLGVAAQKAGRLDEAEEHYESALRSDPRLASALFNLAVLRSGQGNAEGAAELYRRILEDEPDHVRARVNLGYLYISELGRPEQGEAELLQAVQTDPEVLNLIPEPLRPKPPGVPDEGAESGSAPPRSSTGGTLAGTR